MFWEIMCPMNYLEKHNYSISHNIVVWIDELLWNQHWINWWDSQKFSYNEFMSLSIFNTVYWSSMLYLIDCIVIIRPIWSIYSSYQTIPLLSTSICWNTIRIWKQLYMSFDNQSGFSVPLIFIAKLWIMVVDELIMISKSMKYFLIAIIHQF